MWGIEVKDCGYIGKKIESRGYMLRESILEVNAALNTLKAQAVEHPQFREVRNIVYFLKRDLLMLSRRLGFYDLELKKCFQKISQLGGTLKLVEG